jgi:hypothetical protein
VRLHATAIRPRIRHHERGHDPTRRPPEATGNPIRHAYLFVRLRHRLPRLEDAGLQFGDQEDTGSRIEREVVDAPPVPVLVVGHLTARHPPLRPELRPPLTELRMICIEQPVELAATPHDGDDEATIQCLHDPFEGGERAGPEPAVLQPRDDRCAAPGTSAEPGLRPISAMSQSADGTPDSLTAHQLIVAADAYRSVTGGLPFVT